MTDLRWAQVSQDAFNVAILSYIVAMVAYFAFVAFGRAGVARVARSAAIGGLAANVLSVAARGLAAHRVPWGGMYEYSVLLVALVVASYLLFVERAYGVRSLGGFVLMFGVLTLAIAAEFFYVPPGPLVPALNSYWIKIHVVAAIAGSSLFALGGILTILYLVQDRREVRDAEALGSQDPPPILGAADATAPHDLMDDAAAAVGSAVAPGKRRLPSAATLDTVAYRVIAFAFPIWTFAVIAGAIWAQETWGRYWGWDPKETWSFITWTIFAGYLHARATSGWRGRKAAWIALAGFVSLLITYYAVNLWIVGLHSYKGF